jgi:hypothetical protein
MADPYLTPAEVRARESAVLLDEDRYPDDLIARAVTQFEGIAEDYRGRAFVVREETETAMARQHGHIMLNHWPVVAVTAVVVDGVAVADLADRLTQRSMVVRRSTGRVIGGPWYVGSELEITYTHGKVPSEAELEILRSACSLYVRKQLTKVTSGGQDEIIATTGEFGTTRYSTANKRMGRATGYLEVDRLLDSLPDYRVPAIG